MIKSPSEYLVILIFGPYAFAASVFNIMILVT